MPTQPFRFLDLPPEIREKIYIQISTSPHPYIPLNAPDAHASFPLNFLLTNAQIYHELRPLYFTVNSVSITVLKHNEAWSYFLSPYWQDNRREIRKLRLNVVRWGTKDFFVRALVPALEDCILNGKLRNLEVRVRYMAGFSSGSSAMLRNPNWISLRRLLRDPYLERGVLMTGTASKTVVPGEDPVLWRYASDGHEPFLNVKTMFDFEEDIWRPIPEDSRKNRGGLGMQHTITDHRIVTLV